MKTKKLLLAIALAGIIVGASGTAAYFTANDSASTVFTLGNVSAEISEPAWDPTADHVITSGASFGKDPRVTNTGANDAYIRVHISFDNTQLAALRSAADNDSLSAESLLVGLEEDVWKKQSAPLAPGSNTTTLDYIYYKSLPAGDTTDPVFTSVKFPASINTTTLQSELEGNFVISVSADAVQAASFENAEAAFAAFDQQ